MPSRPRLSTPARSTTSSPEAASISGVEAVITVSRIASMNSMERLLRTNDADAVEDERVAGEHVEQQDTLEHLGEIERHFQRDLRVLPADERQREEQRRDQDADRIEPAEERHDDRGEAVARRDAGLEMMHGRRHLDDAGEARERARDREGKERQRLVVEPGKARRARSRADEPDLETLQRAADHDRGDDHDDDRDDR